MMSHNLRFKGVIWKIIPKLSLLSSPGRSPGRAILLPPAVASALAKCLSFYVKVFYMMGKALSGELSCPCDICLVPFLFWMSETWLLHL